eukprot:TRINITY_DN75340_c0_g1_i1.p1 TRINITY_DN75340_c0_g1~~TRINITY_DN75340_c0_g1_i1.p1  ORF type:complete len:371 (+),score=56.50 TRINITY_DN75340_c0_g1_i1:68-1180(+)
MRFHVPTAALVAEMLLLGLLAEDATLVALRADSECAQAARATCATHMLQLRGHAFSVSHMLDNTIASSLLPALRSRDVFNNNSKVQADTHKIAGAPNASGAHNMVESRHAVCQPQYKHGEVETLYHQTSCEIGPLILRNGFRSGSHGWCGGGIYFATSPRATDYKAAGPDSHKGFLIEAKVRIGRLAHANKHCKINGRTLVGHHLHNAGYDTTTFNPGDGVEYVVYCASQILSMKQIPHGRGCDGRTPAGVNARHRHWEAAGPYALSPTTAAWAAKMEAAARAAAEAARSAAEQRLTAAIARAQAARAAAMARAQAAIRAAARVKSEMASAARQARAAATARANAARIKAATYWRAAARAAAARAAALSR